MASKKTLYGSTKRFGPRYGRTLKHKTGKIEGLQDKEYKCPKCHYDKVERVSKGIWHCSKCDAKFTSKAYTVSKLPLLKAEHKEE